MSWMGFEKEGEEGGLLFEDRGGVCDFLFCEVRVKVGLHRVWVLSIDDDILVLELAKLVCWRFYRILGSLSRLVYGCRS